MVDLFTWLGLALSLWLVLFQLMLAGGAPIGHLAWGGQHKGKLPIDKRGASAFSAILMALYVSAFGQAAGLWHLWPERPLFWLMAAGLPLFALSTLGNIATSSRAERRIGAPVAFGMLCACAMQVFA